MERFRGASYGNTAPVIEEECNVNDVEAVEHTDKVTVWEAERCVQCAATKRLMGKLAIDFTTELLSEHPEEVERFKEANFTTAPIVESPIGTWSGFRDAKIKELAEYYQQY